MKLSAFMNESGVSIEIDKDEITLDKIIREVMNNSTNDVKYVTIMNCGKICFSCSKKEWNTNFNKYCPYRTYPILIEGISINYTSDHCSEEDQIGYAISVHVLFY